jgi:hypothetical protein
VSLQVILQLEGVAGFAIELDRGVPGHCQCLMIGRERVIRNGRMEEVVHFRSRHDEEAQT